MVSIVLLVHLVRIPLSCPPLALNVALVLTPTSVVPPPVPNVVRVQLSTPAEPPAALVVVLVLLPMASQVHQRAKNAALVSILPLDPLLALLAPLVLLAPPLELRSARIVTQERTSRFLAPQSALTVLLVPTLMRASPSVLRVLRDSTIPTRDKLCVSLVPME